MKIEVVKHVLESNDEIANKNRELFHELGIFTINLMSSPGAGKTSLLEQIIPRLGSQYKIKVIEGDLYTTKDAERMERLGIETVQINTLGACHIDAGMVKRAFERLELQGGELVIIENVGNLVCPAEFELGEEVKVMVSSITEGNDKPKKYPLMFEKSEVVVLNKIDLLPFTDFCLEEFERDIDAIHPGILSIPISCKTNEGINELCDWLEIKIKQFQERHSHEMWKELQDE